MKTLDQIEARTIVNAANTPGDANNLFIISQPGSYYLTTNLFGVSNKYGIKISTNNVTLDLNGFSVVGTASANAGIYIIGGGNIVVRNGIVTGWTGGNEYGVYCGGSGRNTTIEGLTVATNYYGIYGTFHTVIRNCTVGGNLASGILAGSWCSILANYCDGNNTYNYSSEGGISTIGGTNRIEGNYLTANGYSGITLNSNSSYTNNIIIKNSVVGNGANNYIITGGQISGPIVSTTAAGVITNSNPWANFSF